MTKIKIAAAQYKLANCQTWQQYEQHHQHLIRQVKKTGAKIFILPEYVGMELRYLCREKSGKDFTVLQAFLPDYLQLFQKLANENEIYILAGTLPVQIEEGKFRNRAYFFTPHNAFDFQDKLNLVASEHEEQLLVSGNEIKLFSTQYGKIGIAICYDSEFPALVNQMTTAGAEIILVPSCTASLWGYYRVQLSCRSRALENQCYVVSSYLIGQYEWDGIIEEVVGAAGIFTPIDAGFPKDGILMQGEMNKEEIIASEIDLRKMHSIREHGATRNFKDMKENKKYNLMEYNIK